MDENSKDAIQILLVLTSLSVLLQFAVICFCLGYIFG